MLAFRKKNNSLVFRENKKNQRFRPGEKALKEIITTFEGLKAVKGHPYCSVKISMLNEFISKEKTEKQWHELLGFLAIKSILGKSKYSKTNYKHILSRMLGLASYKDLIKIKLTEGQNRLIDQYTRSGEIAQDKMKRLLNRLELNWKVITYGTYTRGIYVSVKGRSTLDELVKIREERRETNQVKELNQRKNNALLRYKATLNPSIKSTEFE